LVNEVVAHEALLPRALELAQAIARWDPELIATVKNVLDRGAQTTLEESGRIEGSALAERKARGGMQWRS
jgi:enoyl-CoA hydratase